MSEKVVLYATDQIKDITEEVWEKTAKERGIRLVISHTFLQAVKDSRELAPLETEAFVRQRMTSPEFIFGNPNRRICTSLDLAHYLAEQGFPTSLVLGDFEKYFVRPSRKTTIPIVSKQTVSQRIFPS